jgi:hypothetical protein
MTAVEFVANWRREKDEMLRLYLSDHGETAVSQKIMEMGLNEQQAILLRDVLDVALTDTFYTLLLGLDGAASIGGNQQSYRVLDESDALVCCGDGRLEAEAYLQFHQNL